MADLALPDARIPLSSVAPDPDGVLKAYASAFSVQEMKQNWDMKQQDIHDNAKMSEVLKTLNPNDPEYMTKATDALVASGVSPTKIGQFRTQQLAAKADEAKIEADKFTQKSQLAQFLKTQGEAELNAMKAGSSLVASAASDAVSVYDSIASKGGANSKAAAQAAAQQLWSQHLTGIANNDRLPEATRKAALEKLNEPFDVNLAKQLALSSAEHATMVGAVLDEQKIAKGQADINKTRADTAKTYNDIQIAKDQAAALQQDNTDMGEAAGAQVAMGVPMKDVISGNTKDAVAQRAAARRAAVGQIMEDYPGMSARQAGELLTKRQTQFAQSRDQAKAAGRTLGTREANLLLAANEVNEFGSIAVKAMEDTTRTGFRPLNSIISKVASTWSPQEAKFHAANQTLINAYAQLAARGVPTVHSSQEAGDMLNRASTPEQYRQVVKQLQQEVEGALQAVRTSTSQIRENAGSDGTEQNKVVNFGDLK